MLLFCTCVLTLSSIAYASASYGHIISPDSDEYSEVYEGLEETSEAAPEEDNGTAKPAWYEKIFASIIAIFGKGVSWLLNSMGVSLDGIVMGRVSKNGIATSKYFNFELVEGNVFGGASIEIYRIFRKLAYILLILSFGFELAIQGIKGTATSKNEFKQFLYDIIVRYLLLALVPVLVDYAIYSRDAFMKWTVSSLIPSNGKVELISVFKQNYEDTKSIVNAFMYTASVGVTFWYMFVYVVMAFFSMALLAFFPVIAVISIKNKAIMASWVKYTGSNIFIPLVDSIMLCIPIVVVSNAPDDNKLFMNILGLLVCASVIPVRGYLLSIVGINTGMSGVGLGSALLRSSMRRAMRMGRKGANGITGGIKERVGKYKENKKYAEMEGELADLEKEQGLGSGSTINKFGSKYNNKDTDGTLNTTDPFNDSEAFNEENDDNKVNSSVSAGSDKSTVGDKSVNDAKDNIIPKNNTKPTVADVEIEVNNNEGGNSNKKSNFKNIDELDSNNKVVNNKDAIDSDSKYEASINNDKNIDIVEDSSLEINKNKTNSDINKDITQELENISPREKNLRNMELANQEIEMMESQKSVLLTKNKDNDIKIQELNAANEELKNDVDSKNTKLRIDNAKWQSVLANNSATKEEKDEAKVRISDNNEKIEKNNLKYIEGKAINDSQIQSFRVDNTRNNQLSADLTGKIGDKKQQISFMKNNEIGYAAQMGGKTYSNVDDMQNQSKKNEILSRYATYENFDTAQFAGALSHSQRQEFYKQRAVKGLTQGVGKSIVAGTVKTVAAVGGASLGGYGGIDAMFAGAEVGSALGENVVDFVSGAGTTLSFAGGTVGNAIINKVSIKDNDKDNSSNKPIVERITDIDNYTANYSADKRGEDITKVTRIQEEYVNINIEENGSSMRQDSPKTEVNIKESEEIKFYTPEEVERQLSKTFDETKTRQNNRPEYKDE